MFWVLYIVFVVFTKLVRGVEKRWKWVSEVESGSEQYDETKGKEKEKGVSE